MQLREIDRVATKAQTMKHSITIGAAILAFTAAAASCATLEGETSGGDKVYLIGVAGGG